LKADDLIFNNGYDVSQYNIISLGYYYVLQYRFTNKDGIRRKISIRYQNKNHETEIREIIMKPFEEGTFNIESSLMKYDGIADHII
jgi:hypothetical protein